MRIIVVPEADGRYRLRALDGVLPGRNTVEHAELTELERDLRPRWVVPSTESDYPPLLRSGVRLDKCHDLALTESLLLGYAGAHDAPRALPAAWARLHGLPEPPDALPPEQPAQPTLFEPNRSALPKDVDPLEAATEVYRAQVDAIERTTYPERMRLLAAAESAGGLAAAEMSEHGLPWRADVHADLLHRLLGARPPTGERPPELARLAERISTALGSSEINPDHPPSVLKAFAAAGIDLPSARASALREVDHPAVPPLLEYKELARLWVAHGWSWLHTWVRDGRFHPVYVVGGVVSGRWASRGGAALQLPKELRTAVRADEGHRLVVADAAQLEPRVLAALSGDGRLAGVADSSDLYSGLATDSFDGDRSRAKVAMLSALYGGTSGQAGQLLSSLRERFPTAVDYVEAAALAGERGERVRSHLGRTSPAPGQEWWQATGQSSSTVDDERRSRRIAREWGRFTRNFVIQATAAEWALALLATLRGELAAHAPGAEVVFFQHDEILVHCPAELAGPVEARLRESAEKATRLVFGATPVHFPLEIATVECYADAK